MLSSSQYAALIYADIFNYPLTEEELDRWLIAKSKQQQKKIIKKNGYYCLEGREEIVGWRKKREKYSDEKMIITERVSQWLGKIPTVWAVCVTGSLAMKNCDENDDIDLMIITEPGRLWTTRLLCILLTEILGVRRRKGDKEVKNKICLNIFLDGGDLLIKNQNLFTAHEVCQAKCLYEKNGAYESFFEENRWVRDFLPKFPPSSLDFTRDYGEASKIQIIEKLLKHIQLYFMKSHVTTEKITETQLFFHPESIEKEVLDRMQFII